MSNPHIPHLESEPNTLLINVMFCLSDEGGHIYPQNIAVGKAAQRLGWHARGWARAAATLAAVPAHWSLCLGARHTRFRGILGGIEKTFVGIRTLTSLLHALRTENWRNVILFADWFGLIHLLILTAALFLSRRSPALHFWPTYRLTGTAFDVLPDRLLLALIELRLGRGHVTVLTDSETTRPILERTHKRSVHVLPFPLSDDIPPASPGYEQKIMRLLPIDKLRCWWPGRPSVEKGSATIDAIVQRKEPDMQAFALVASERYAMPAGARMQRVLVPDPLTPSEYHAWMRAIDVVLLPYDPVAYATRTSNVFTEAVIAGRIPFVSDGTWMADELHRFGASEFIVDWNRPDLFHYMREVIADERMRAKIVDFGRNFREYHSEAGFARELGLLFDRTAAFLPM